MDAAKSVSIRVEQTAAGSVERIKVVIGDLHLRCDVTSDRDIRLAKRLSEDHGTTFECDEATSERVRAALNDEAVIASQTLMIRGVCLG